VIAASRRSAVYADLRRLGTRIKPLTSLGVAVAVAAATLTLFPGVPIGITEITYFLLAPWFLANAVVYRRTFFGARWDRGLTVSMLGAIAVAVALYLTDVTVRAVLVGPVHLSWSPAPLHLSMLASASALDETVILQVGLQSRMKGWGGVVVVGILFCIIHVSLNPLFLVAGMALAALQHVTGRPGAPFIAHLVYNALISALPPLPQ
jgi:membrane protease YdiL (CAAX protease family)